MASHRKWHPNGPDPCCTRLQCCNVYSVDQCTKITAYCKALSGGDRRSFAVSRILQPRSTSRKQYYMDPPASVDNDLLRVTVAPHGNLRVCAAFFRHVVGCSTTFISQPSIPSKRMCRELPGRIRKRPKFNQVVMWLLAIAAFYQLSPDSNFIFLPFPRRRDVFNLFLLEMKEEDDEFECDPSHFFKTWKEHVDTNNIKLRKHLRFAMCDTCINFRELREETRDSKAQKELFTLQKEHHDFVKNERTTYYCRRMKGAEADSDYLSMIVDGADQGKYAVPYHHVRTHNSGKCLRLPVHLMGVLVHGRRPHAFTYYENIKHGNNVTIEAIYQALAYELKRGKLPSKLYLQLDNTVKQCKSQYMIGFLAYLVLKGVFKYVVCSFLPVGHTHEDIDQFFSRIATYLMCHDALSAEHLHKGIKECFQTKKGQRCRTGHWDRVTNFSEWIKPYMTDFSGITKWHQFRFFKLEGEVRVQCRPWCSKHEEWGGIVANTPYTAAFRMTPPDSAFGIPPAQRRKVLKKKVVDDQIKSVERCARDRKIPARHLASILSGVRSLGSEDDLPCTWDWDSEMHVPEEVQEEEEEEKKDDDVWNGVYEYDIDTTVMIKPKEGSGDQFWLGTVVAHGPGGRLGDYEIWWLMTKDNIKYRPEYLKKHPRTDVVAAAAIQCSVERTTTGKIKVVSKRRINEFVTRWKHRADDNDPDISDGSDTEHSMSEP